MTTLQQRMAEAEETNRDLIAFARGHAGVTAAIHEAVLAALTASDRAALATIVTRDWPVLLDVDAVAFAWADEAGAVAADLDGMRSFEPRLVARMAGMDRAVTVRAVGRGHPLFGADAEHIRAEVLVRLEGAEGIGLLLLGQFTGSASHTPAGERLLRFLGRAASVMLERWPHANSPR